MRMADNVTTFIYRLSDNSRSVKLLDSYGTVHACSGITLPCNAPRTVSRVDPFLAMEKVFVRKLVPVFIFTFFVFARYK